MIFSINVPIIILFASALISLALFVIVELEVDNPIIDLRVFRCYPYTLSLVLISITTTALFTAGGARTRTRRLPS